MEGYSGRRVVKERREETCSVVELPRGSESQFSGMRFQECQRGGHGGEDTKEEHSHLNDGLPCELIRLVAHTLFGGVEAEQQERDEHYLAQELQPDRSVFGSHLRDGALVDKRHAQHHAYQEEEVDVPLQPQRLFLARIGGKRRPVLLLIEVVIHGEIDSQ